MKGDAAEIIVMDLEWTAWEGAHRRHWSAPGEEMEIVQIGAVRLSDSDGLPETGAFEILVRPRINPRLDPYFVNLTGITQAQLDREGMDLRVALDRFRHFSGDGTEVMGFGDELSIVASNCQLYGMRNPFEGTVCGNVRPLVLTGFKEISEDLDSSDLPIALGFRKPGIAHQALSDSRCVAEALRRLRAAGKF